ncbi:MAG: multidrug effflux MFS transporter [Alphaproteobacteria bacterium]|nr:multidrug effflux MFS transporter [Alphaproteobacteria bacterium]
MSELPKSKFLDRTTPPHVMTLVLLAGLSALSMNIFLPSLPNMAAYFKTDYALMQLSVSLYLGVTGVLQVIIGPASDRYGRRPVILIGLVVFMLATIGCLLAKDVTTFLIFRMIQTGIATGIVLSRAIIRDIVPMDKAASMIGYVTMGMALVPMAAPALGGILDELFGWQANFSMLLILGALIGGLIYFDLGETNIHRSPSLMAQARDYPELFRSRRFWGYALTAAFASGSFFAFLGGAPFIGTTYFGLSSSGLGIYFGIVSLGYVAGNFLSGRYSTRFGINRMMLYGSFATLGGLVLSTLVIAAGATHPLAFFGFMFAVGIGNGMVLPNANAGMLSVRPQLAGSASGLGGSIMLLGGASLAALTGVILTPGSGPFRLLALMILTSVLAVFTVLYIMRVARQAGPLNETEHH